MLLKLFPPAFHDCVPNRTVTKYIKTFDMTYTGVQVKTIYMDKYIQNQ